MALTLGAGSATEWINLGAGASLGDLDPFTLLYWLNPTTLTGGRLLYRKAGTGIKLFTLNGTGGNVQMQFQRAGGFTNYLTNDTPLASTGSWIFLAGDYDSSAAAGEIHNIYKGTLTAAATECTYGTATDSSGATLADAAGDFIVGGRVSQPNAFQGAIAIHAVFNRKLTLAEIVSWQWQPRMMSGCVALHHFGFNGTSTQPDYSGNGNSGSVSGPTQSAHVPLGQPFTRGVAICPSVVAAAAARRRVRIVA